MSTDKQSSNREALLKVATLVRPALATQAYIPALTNINFDGSYATAYNDISAIRVKAKVDLKRSVPGELLIRALSSFGAEQIMFQPDGASHLVLSSGRSKVKLPTLANKDFPFTWPAADSGHELQIDGAIIKGVERCLISVGNDPTHPAQMGVTLDVDSKGYAVLFSTDNFSISRYQTKAKLKLPGDSPVILPRFFCEQLVSLSKVFTDEQQSILLVLHPGGLEIVYGEAAGLFTKTPVDLEPLDFPKIVSKHYKIESKGEDLSPIPDSFDAAFGRALLVLSGEVDKVTKISIDDSAKSNQLEMHSSSSMGDSDDRMDFAGKGPDKDFHVDPSLVVRASKNCALVGFSERVIVLADADANFIHLIAHCAA